ncbi:hypothetical protein J3D54_001763 [Pseudomonas sp. GGS8]|uniref:hypothetical protein n=1 Tax=Pseudomonas sp. GGS8 TaxID=2817892 RepID=UPI0020A188C6|nr:hypothetical protein [Pseudomonas sp. GGS8]MCP1442631.1 hypothetical protein [Pseudomonas sp. GGS8]
MLGPVMEYPPLASTSVHPACVKMIWLQRFLMAMGVLACVVLVVIVSSVDKAMAGVAHE